MTSFNIAVFTRSKVTPLLEDLINASLKRTVIASKIVLVHTCTATAPSLKFAEQKGIIPIGINPKGFSTSVSYASAVLDQLKKHHIDLIVLVHFRRKLDDDILERFKNRIIMSTPVLDPKHFHRATMSAKQKQIEVLKKGHDAGLCILKLNKSFSETDILAQISYQIPNFITAQAKYDDNSYLENASKDLADLILPFESRILIDVIKKIERQEIVLDKTA